MQARIRRKLSMAARALDFANAHPLPDPGFATVVARLQASVERGDALAEQERTGKITENVAQNRRTALRKTIRQQQLRRLATIAGIAAKTHPEVAGLFPVPSAKSPNKVILVAAHEMASAATPYRELLTSLGLGATFFDDLVSNVTAIETTTQTAHAGRSEHVFARRTMTSVAAECKVDVEVLDTYYHAAFQGQEDFLAAWASARNEAGPFKHPAEAPAPPPSPTEPPVPGVTPAAGSSGTA